MFKVKIETGNAAFDDAPASEIARILRNLAAELEEQGVPEDGADWKLMDANGNTCGFAHVEERAR